jgi:hypothetical protein
MVAERKVLSSESAGLSEERGNLLTEKENRSKKRREKI